MVNKMIYNIALSYPGKLSTVYEQMLVTIFAISQRLSIK